MSTTYLGFPVRLPEAFRIFNIEFDDEAYENGRMCHEDTQKCIERAKKYFRNHSTNFGIYPTDKGQYIIGYKINEFSDVWTDFCSVNNAITLLVNLKTQFAAELIKLNADITHVILEGMESEPQTVYSPDPFVMTYY